MDIKITVCLLKPGPLIKRFNIILQGNFETEEWVTSILATIHKRGSNMSVENYRAISMLSCTDKLFAAILNKRLLKYDHNIHEQLGFVVGNRTSDLIIQHY